MAILGLITTIAIAWTCAWRINIEAVADGCTLVCVVRDGEVLIDTQVLDKAFGSERICPRPHFSCIVRWTSDGIDMSPLPETVRSPAKAWWLPLAENEWDRPDEAIARGWPVLCLRADIWWQAGSITSPQRRVSGGIDVAPKPTASGSAMVLPLIPIWRGLVIDTAVCASAWLLMLAAPIQLRRAVRTRRGLCPRCAYDLRHSLATGCPECGWRRPGANAPSPRAATS